MIMAKDVVYTNGVIAVRENGLLKDKLIKFAEGSAKEAFTALKDGGFGRGAEAEDEYAYEKLVLADELDIDEFVREYAPTNAEKEYFLAPRDFHNAKALFKAEKLGVEALNMLSPEGLIPVAELSRTIKSGEYSALNPQLSAALSSAEKLFADGGNENAPAQVSGAEVGIIFDEAMFLRLFKVCGKNALLKKLLQTKADYANILTAFRSQTPEYAQSFYISGGKLPQESLAGLFNADVDVSLVAPRSKAYQDFIKVCIAEKSNGRPLTSAERIFESFETDFLAEKKYELKCAQPFLYYVLRRRAENANVRILMGGLLSGLGDSQIKSRLRTY